MGGETRLDARREGDLVNTQIRRESREDSVARFALALQKETESIVRPLGDPLTGMLALIAVELARANDLQEDS
jgi:hypothetical protein